MKLLKNLIFMTVVLFAVFRSTSARARADMPFFILDGYTYDNDVASWQYIISIIPPFSIIPGVSHAIQGRWNGGESFRFYSDSYNYWWQIGLAAGIGVGIHYKDPLFGALAVPGGMIVGPLYLGFFRQIIDGLFGPIVNGKMSWVMLEPQLGPEVEYKLVGINFDF